VILIVKSHSGLSRIAAFFTLVVSIACIGALAGCGQQGPLYMPDRPLDAHGKPKKAVKSSNTASPTQPADDTGYVPPPVSVPE
jgi:predicted small lipoprotein YifL